MAIELALSCPKCGRPLAARAPQGLCRSCLAGSLLGPDPEPEPALQLEPGTVRRFGDYELIGEIARGGMGVIYRARQISLNRPVALKFVALWGASADFLERFELEAEASARLSHPNIVPIYGYGEHDGQPFLSMRPLSESLDRKIAREPLDLKAAVELVIKVARAAHFAHQRGVIHRDIKPSNILLDEAGEPFLADFGLAKLIERDSALTRTRSMLGTPSYISPEQALGKTDEITTAADVYSLGAVLYELITGQPPFAGGTTLDTVRQVIDREPRVPSTLNPKAGRDLDTICLHCLEKKPLARYASAEALADDLERWSRWLPIAARPITPWERAGKWVRRHPAWAFSLTASVVALVAISIISTVARQKLARMGEERRAQLVRLNLATAERLVDAGGTSSALHWQLQAMQLETDPAEAELQRLAMGALLRETPQVEAMFFHGGPVTYATFSPDGRRLVTTSDDQTACLWDAASGKRLLEPLRHRAAVYYAAFSPDGKLLVTCADDGTAQVWNSSTGKPLGKPLPCLSAWYRRPMVPGVEFRKDSRAILTRAGDVAQIWDPLTGEKLGGPFPHAKTVRQAVFSPDGQSVLTASDDGTAKIWDASQHAEARIVLRHRAGVEGATFSPDGKRVATYENWGGVAYIWNAVTGEPIALPLKNDKDRRLVQCVFSPDGSKLLTVGFDSFVRVWNGETGQRIWEEQIPVGVSMAAFSPDSKRLVAAGFDLTARVFDAANGKLAWPILQHSALVYASFFDASGDRVLAATENGVAQLWHWSREQASPFSLEHGSAITTASVDPAGQHLVTAGVTKETKVWDLQGGRLVRRVPQEGRVTQSLLGEGGTSLINLTDDGVIHLWPLGAEGLAEREITNDPPARHLALSPDQSHLLVTGDQGATLWEPTQGRRIGGGLEADRQLRFGAFSPDGKRFVTGAADGTAQIRETAGGNAVGATLRQKGRVDWAAFSPDGKRLVTASVDQSYSPLGASIWEVESGRRLAGPLMHRDGVSLVEFSPDGRRVATAGEDAIVQVWEAGDGRPTAPPIMQATRVTTLAFSPDSRMLATGNFGGVARIWSARTGEPLTPPLTHADRVILVRFMPAEKGLLVVSADGKARIWNLTANDESNERLTDRARILSSHRFDMEAGLVPLDRASLSNTWHRLRPE